MREPPMPDNKKERDKSEKCSQMIQLKQKDKTKSVVFQEGNAVVTWYNRGSTFKRSAVRIPPPLTFSDVREASRWKTHITAIYSGGISASNDPNRKDGRVFSEKDGDEKTKTDSKNRKYKKMYIKTCVFDRKNKIKDASLAGCQL